MNKFALLLSLLCLFFGCQKKETAPDAKQLLTQHAWKLDKVLVNGVEVNDPQLLSVIKEFNQATVDFHADGTVTSTDRSTGTVTNGTWQFQNDQKELEVNISPNTYDFDVMSLTTDSLILTSPYTITTPVNTTVKVELRLIPA